MCGRLKGCGVELRTLDTPVWVYKDPPDFRVWSWDAVGDGRPYGGWHELTYVESHAWCCGDYTPDVYGKIAGEPYTLLCHECAAKNGIRW